MIIKNIKNVSTIIKVASIGVGVLASILEQKMMDDKINKIVTEKIAKMTKNGSL